MKAEAAVITSRGCYFGRVYRSGTRAINQRGSQARAAGREALVGGDS
jgi:hypothetical protein